MTLKYKEIAEDSMVIPLNCSSSLESRYLTLPAIRWEMIPLVANNESLNEVLPWSTCAKIQMFLIHDASSCSLFTVSGEIFMILIGCSYWGFNEDESMAMKTKRKRKIKKEQEKK